MKFWNKESVNVIHNASLTWHPYSATCNILSSISEGTSNFPDIWSAVNGLNQHGYEGALGVTSSHQTQAGNYSSLQPHGHLVRFTSRITYWLLQPGTSTVCMSFFSCLGLLSTPGDCNRHEQRSSTHVHVSPQQCIITCPIDQHNRQFHRWGSAMEG